MGFSGTCTHFALGLGIFLHLQTVLASPNVQNRKGDALLKAEAGQFLFVGISDTTLSPRTAKDLKEIKPGAVILFKRNITSIPATSALTSALQKASREYSNQTLIIATDQEGGKIARVEMNPPMPSPLALGLTKDRRLVEAISYETGKFLRYLGFNMNLAPVLDILSSSGITFIGERSFGFDAQTVSELGVAFAEGQLRAGVLPTSKHFPGAGVLTKDPHVEKVSSAHFSADALNPFRQFSGLFPSAIMLSHSSYPTLDSTGVPATFSKKIVSDILIKQLGYKGLIVTDDLRMGATMSSNLSLQARESSVGELAVKSFLAGADLLMITWGPLEQTAARDALFNAVKTGRIPRAVFDARVKKVAGIKQQLGPLLRRPASLEKINTYDSKTMARLDNQVLQKNLAEEFHRIIKPKTSERFVVVGRTQQFRMDFERAMGHPVGGLAVQDFFKISSGSSQETALLQKYDCVIFPIYTHKDALFLSSVSKEVRLKTIAINFASPGLVDESSLRGLVNLFHPHRNTAFALGKILSGSSLISKNAADIKAQALFSNE
jgi:beta-N-acetylhexosaminidase